MRNIIGINVKNGLILHEHLDNINISKTACPIESCVAYIVICIEIKTQIGRIFNECLDHIETTQ